MNCERASQHMLDLIYNEADPALRKELDGHLNTCESCAAELAALQRTVGALNAWTPLENPVDAPSLTRSATETDRLLRESRPCWRSFQPALIGVAAALVFVAGAAWLGTEVDHTTDGWTVRFRSIASNAEPDDRMKPPSNEYMLILYENPSQADRMDADELRRAVREYVDWAGGLARRNQFVAGEKLADDGRMVSRSDDNSPTTSGGPFMRDGEVITGFFRIRAQSYNDAVRISRTCPHLKYGTRIELREIDETGT